MIVATDPAREFCQRSRGEPDAFWAEQAGLIHWHKPFDQVCDFSRPPFVKWFVGGETNLCYNAVDRHLTDRADQPAIFFLSAETGETRTLTFRDLHREVVRMAACLRSLGLETGDRAVVYMPMVPEAVIAMLACTRLGVIHSTVFAGFAAPSLASRIEDAEAKVVITCDAGKRNGKLVPLKRLVDEALNLIQARELSVLVINRGLDPSAQMKPGRDHDYGAFTNETDIPCVWLESSAPSYLLYTSGTTARPKGIQRDTGGYAVALASSVKHICGGKAGETYFSTADIGWVVGHSYTVYGPLLSGMQTVIYEGLPCHDEGAIWWDIVERTQATVMFSSPTAIRTLKKQAPESFRRHDLRTLRHLLLAGEPLDIPTSTWLRQELKHVEIVDNYWQTETGWPLLTLLPGLGPIKVKPGSPGFPSYGYNVEITDPATGNAVAIGQKGVLTVGLPLPPGCMSTVWRNDEMFEKHYCGQFPDQLRYSTFDYAVQDEDGHYFILGRTDDVINVAGHRLGTREIEETICSHPAVAEVAAIGPADEIKGQTIYCFVTLKRPHEFTSDEARLELIREIEMTVVKNLGGIARPAFIAVVRNLPKTRSGKVVRRALLAIAEERNPGDISTMEDSSVLDEIRDVLNAGKSR